MKKTVRSKEYERANDMIEGCLWENWADFAKDHDMVDASWFIKTEKFYEMDYHFTPDDDDVAEGCEDYYPEIFQYYFTERNTIEDIEHFNIYTPYFEHYNEDIYIIGIIHYGTSWKCVPMLYLLDDDGNEEND